MRRANSSRPVSCRARPRPLQAVRRRCRRTRLPPRGVAGPTGHLQDPRRGFGAAHRGPACAGTHAGARGPGSRGRAQGGAPVADGALYCGAPPGVTPRSRTAGRIAGARLGEGRVVHQGVFSDQVHQGSGGQDPADATPAPCVHPLRMREDGMVLHRAFRQRAACLSRPSLEEGVRAGRSIRGEDGVLLAFMKDQWSGVWGHRAVRRSLHAAGKGEHRMHSLCHIPFVVALSLVISMMPISLAVSAPAGHHPALRDLFIHSPSSPGSAWPSGHPTRPRPGTREGQAE